GLVLAVGAFARTSSQRPQAPAGSATQAPAGHFQPTGTCNLGPWAYVATYPAGAAEAPAVAGSATYLYSGAGYVGGASNGFYRYDPIANSWSTLANVPQALYATRAVYAPNTN